MHPLYPVQVTRKKLGILERTAALSQLIDPLAIVHRGEARCPRLKVAIDLPARTLAPAIGKPSESVDRLYLCGSAQSLG